MYFIKEIALFQGQGYRIDKDIYRGQLCLASIAKKRGETWYTRFHWSGYKYVIVIFTLQFDSNLSTTNGRKLCAASSEKLAAVSEKPRTSEAITFVKN